MSDLKKTFQDMDKTEVGEYRHGRGHFPTEDDGGRANVEVLQALCPNPGATALESVVWAADQIEALRRENEELRGQLQTLEYLEAERIEHEQPTITPEMREILKRAFALAREIEDRELAEDLCGLLIRTDPKQARLNTGGEG